MTDGYDQEHLSRGNALSYLAARNCPEPTQHQVHDGHLTLDLTLRRPLQLSCASRAATSLHPTPDYPSLVHSIACRHPVVGEPAHELMADSLPVGIQYITLPTCPGSSSSTASSQWLTRRTPIPHRSNSSTSAARDSERGIWILSRRPYTRIFATSLTRNLLVNQSDQERSGLDIGRRFSAFGPPTLR
jgi:hypothetical protein